MPSYKLVEECRGCKSYIMLPLKAECRFTIEGVSDIPDCPCKKCLVKVVCVEVCDPLSKIIKKLHSTSTYKNLPEDRYKT